MDSSHGIDADRPLAPGGDGERFEAGPVAGAHHGGGKKGGNAKGGNRKDGGKGGGGKKGRVKQARRATRPLRPRPPGISSRMVRVPGPRRPWQAPDGHVVDLPVTLDVVSIDPARDAVQWMIVATVDRVSDEPALVRMELTAAEGLDPRLLQTEFRWATPLEVVTRTVPQLLAMQVDPFDYDFPVTGFPDAAEVDRPARNVLTDAFLRDVAVRYVDVGRGYAETIAAERGVSPRTVVSWIEKARKRGLLSQTKPGVHGGEVIG